MSLLIGYRTMFDTARNDKEFPLFQPNAVVTKLHAESALDDQEQLIFAFVVMPNKWACKPNKLYLLAVQFSDDFGFPVLAEERKLFS
jgi:hypothetical protein